MKDLNDKFDNQMMLLLIAIIMVLLLIIALTAIIYYGWNLLIIHIIPIRINLLQAVLFAIVIPIAIVLRIIFGQEE